MDRPEDANLQPVAADPRATIAALRRFVRPRSKQERCELCAAPLAPEHQHLIDPAKRELVCSCDACAILFSNQNAGKYRRVPRRIEWWPEFRMSDEQWNAIGIPINLAFFFPSTPADQIVSIYPSPAGGTESHLPAETWQILCEENPALAKMEPDVQALLVNRVLDAREYFLAPIDECFKLVGLIRTHWRGMSGGALAWGQIAGFFSDLKARAAEVRPRA
jgi:hypothetical protein